MPPRYRPGHAAPVFGGPPRRWRARRAIKLLVATTSWVLALGLVVGAIAMVAGATAPGRLHANASILDPSFGRGDQPKVLGHSRHMSRHTSSAHHTPPAVQRPGSQRVLRPERNSMDRRIVYTFHGGSSWFKSIKLLSLVSAKWQLHWSYSCPANEVGGSFSLTETGTASTQASINESGPGGHGMAMLTKDGRMPGLAVTSSCSWRLKIVGIM